MSAQTENAPTVVSLSKEDKSLMQSLCDLEIPQCIQISPNGQRILYATSLDWGHCKGKHPVSTLWIAATGEQRSSRQLTSGLFNDREPRWSPSGQSVAFISDRAKAGEQWAIYVLPLGEGGEAYPVTPAENEQEIATFEFSPDGKRIIFVSPDEKSEEQKKKESDEETDADVWGEKWEFARLRIVDVETKEVKCLTETVERHVMDACWASDGARVAFTSSRNTDIEEPFLTGTTISVIDVLTKESRDICTFPGELQDLTWGEDGKLYFCGGVPANKSCAGKAVYAVGVNHESPVYEKIAYGVEDDVESLRKAGSNIVASLQHGFETWISILGGKVLFKKKTVFDVWDAAYKPDSDEMILAIGLSDINHPMEIFTTTAVENDKLVQLSNHGHPFKDRLFGTCTFLSCRSSDDLEQLDGVFLTPTLHASSDGTPKRPIPTFVMMHGGPCDRNSDAFNAYYYMWTPYILSKGYGILLPQYRGSSGRGEKFASYSLGGVGIYDYSDVITLTNHAITQGFSDKAKLIVGGYSQGGYLTYLCAVRNGLHGYGWRFNAGIAGAGVCDVDSLPLSADMGSTFEPELNGGYVVWNMDKDDTRNRKASALWEVSGAVKKMKESGEMVIPPLLILHGEQDVRCPFSQAQGFRRAMQAYALPYEFVKYPRQEHMIKEQRFWIDMLERIGRWCDRFIGSGMAE